MASTNLNNSLDNKEEKSDNLENKAVIKKFNITDQDTCIVFTDGSCEPNKACKESKASYAARFAYGKLKNNVLYGVIDTSVCFATNQRGEGTAILKILEFLKKNLSTWNRVIIVTDSDFWIKMFTSYMPKWSESDFNKKANPDLTVVLWNLYSKLIDKYNKKIEFQHVYSHNKSNLSSYKENSYEYFSYIYNDYVDQMATYARLNFDINRHIVEYITD
jgi:ribonuclease HI